MMKSREPNRNRAFINELGLKELIMKNREIVDFLHYEIAEKLLDMNLSFVSSHLQRSTINYGKDECLARLMGKKAIIL